MQYLPVICLVILILDCLATTESSLSSEPYCSNNVTVLSHKIVTKTRLKTVIKKGFFNKIAQKKETQVEVYEAFEPIETIKVKLGCCEGYKRNAYQVCEPQCVENSCPANSRCVEPEVCECRAGYMSVRSEKDGKFICQPICDMDCPAHSECVGPNQCACKHGYRVTEDRQCKPHCDLGCPHGGVCVAPNECECSKGYKPQQGTCVQICDHCENGNCLNEHVCICNDDFTYNLQLLKCVSNNNENDWETSTYYPESTVDPDDASDDGSITIETDIDTDRDDIDPNEVFDEIIPSTTYDPFEDSSTTYTTGNKNHKCPDDYVYHKGVCHPLKFAANDIDCRFKSCEDPHAICHVDNGTCICKEGYVWFKTHVVDHDTLNHTIKPICLTTEEYSNRLQQQQADTKDLNESGSSWTTIFFIILGVLVMVAALVFLGFKLLRTQTGHLDVEGKNLSCSYDSRACVESEKSVI